MVGRHQPTGAIMSYVFNSPRQKSRRKSLRRNMTRAEIVLWYSLKGKQLLGYKFRRQHGVDQYILDFYCPELNLAIEVDGESHSSGDARRRDAKRQKEIEVYGIRFLRFTDDEVLGNPDRVVDAIERKVRQLEDDTTTPSSPPP